MVRGGGSVVILDTYSTTTIRHLFSVPSRAAVACRLSSSPRSFSASNHLALLAPLLALLLPCAVSPCAPPLAPMPIRCCLRRAPRHRRLRCPPPLPAPPPVVVVAARRLLPRAPCARPVRRPVVGSISGPRPVLLFCKWLFCPSEEPRRLVPLRGHTKLAAHLCAGRGQQI